MKRFLCIRILRVVPMVIAISIATFAVLHLSPGGPVGVISGNPKVTGADVERIRESFGLDKPLPVQYLCWFRQVFIRFDFGKSYVNGRPVSSMIVERIPPTLELMGTALLLAALLSFLAGIASALKRNGLIDQLFSLLSTAGMSVPVFWLGLMAIALFSLKMGVLPAGGRETVGESFSFVDRLKHLILPAAVLSVAYLSVWSRYLRVGLLDAIAGDFIRTARAKGLGERTVIFKHALRNAVLPVLTVVIMHVPSLFTGAVITETVFSWPGMGRLFYEGLVRHDYSRVLGIVVISSLLIIIFNLIGDVMYMAVDPRISPDQLGGSPGGVGKQQRYGAAL
jgi:peptide/nickel transport system permease protein